MTPVAYAVERHPSGPPALVSFLPAFWLLVPGALGLIGVTESLAADTAAGIQDFIASLGSIIAIALGVLCGYPLYRSIAYSLGWLSEFRPALRSATGSPRQATIRSSRAVLLKRRPPSVVTVTMSSIRTPKRPAR